MFGMPDRTDALPALLQMQAKGVELAPEHEPPEIIPAAVPFLAALHQRIRSGIAPGLAGPAPITWADFDSFQRVTGEKLTPWLVRQIKAMDNAMLRAWAKRQEGMNNDGSN